jgi:YbbR domain-containing protein
VARVVRFVVRNWPLKLAALGLAFLLYAGLVLSQGVRIWPGPVRIEPINQPTGAFLLEPLGDVTDIRYSSLAEIASGVSSTDFRATVDLRDVQPQPGGAPTVVPVRLIAADPRIQVIDYRPQQVAVRLDRVIQRTVPVFVDRGVIPEGVVLGEATTDVNTVTVRGASSLVERVHEAVARVSIDPNAINVDATVPLIPVDDQNQPVQPVDLTPEQVHVRIQVARQRSTRVVPIVPAYSGSLAPGFEPKTVVVTPPAVTLSGEGSVIGQINSIPTQPIALDGRDSAIAVDVGLALPAGVTAVEQSQVRVSIDVQPQRESRSFDVGLTLTGARSDRTYRLGSTAVLVTLGGTVAALNGIDASRLVGILDVSGLDTGSRDITVRVSPPTGTAVISVGPPRISVTVEAGSATQSPASP